ncbi:MAG TPA: DUF4349 domain-containing protein [Pyrinomonadaceae bacterium]|nr:DUF4349 domain-containing protein [Pyrinomonadaceae bacterium]
MKLAKVFTLLISLSILCGCEKMGSSQRGARLNSAEGLAAKQIAANEEYKTNTQVSLQQADQSQSMAEAANRKILRNGDVTLEVSSPEAAERQITSIADALGGFVVTSESKQHDTGDPAKQYLEVNLVIRVPAAQFETAFKQILSTASRVIQQKQTGQDVTEEFIDLEARIKTQKALEVQFLEIMKQATKVPDALEVQRQIAEVRTEIEKLEGRKRFLENRASLSTITVNLQSPAPIAVNTSGFRRSVREAVSDGVDLTIGIVLFLIRFVIVMIPIFLLLILPLGLLVRFFWRRTRTSLWSRKPGPYSQPPPPDEQVDSQPG